MSIRVGDYLFTRLADDVSAKLVVKVISVGDNVAYCRDVSTGHITGANLSISFSENYESTLELLANLGTKPKVKTIDGLPTRDAVGKISSLDGYKPIWFFYKPEKEELKSYKEAFKRIKELLEKFNLDQYLQEIYFEVHNNESIKASKDTVALYKTTFSQIQIISNQVNRIDEALVDIDEFNHAVLHEFAHHLYLKIKKNTMLMSAWAEAFSEISKCALASSTLKKLVEDFLVSGSSLTGFLKSLDNENEDYATHLSDRQLFKKYCAQAAKLYKLSVKDLDNLSKQGKFTTLEKILLKDIQPLAIRVVSSDAISKYGSKSLLEYFAEAVSAYLTGVVLSKNLSSLIKKTLDIINQDSKSEE